MIYEFTTSANSWYLLAHSINLLNKLRDGSSNSDDISSLNATIILNTAATVEGAISSHFELNFKDHQQYKESAKSNDFVTRAAFDYVFADEESSGFEKKVQLYKNFLHYDLKSVKSWESIKALMQFRNVLAHGSTIKYVQKRVDDWDGTIGNFEEKKEISPLDSIWSKKELIAFLIKSKLVDVDKNKEWKIAYNTAFFYSKVADFFLKESKVFLLDMYSQALGLKSNSFEKHLINHLGVERPKFQGKMTKFKKKEK